MFGSYSWALLAKHHSTPHTIPSRYMLTKMLSYYTLEKKKSMWPNDQHVHYTVVNTI